ncbi:MAG: class I SAM-dependent methyltransferase [Acidobacteria bacterium]|nr:class I SAM-dependent methyltransferase [Acidobacteriota bacterium]
MAPYQFKPSPYSSHGLLLESMPEQGGGMRVLDAGCADGYLSEILARRGYRVTAIEKRATGAFPRDVEFIEADLDRGLPPLAGGFDFIICADILEHLRDPAPLLADLRRLLAPHGRLAASLPNSGHAWFRWNVLMGRFPAEDRGLFDRTHLHFFTWRGWTELFGGAGFRIERVRCSGVPASLVFPRFAHTLPVLALERLSFESARLWKNLFAYQFVVIAC